MFTLLSAVKQFMEIPSRKFFRFPVKHEIMEKMSNKLQKGELLIT